MPFHLPPISTPLAGIYENMDDLWAEMGKYNADVAADPDNDGDVVALAMHKQSAINFADSFINSRLASYGFVTPATVNLGMLRIIGAKLAAFQLYQVRGLQDKKGNPFQEKYDWAVRAMDNLLIGNRGGFNRLYTNAPFVAGSRSGQSQPLYPRS